LKTTIEQIKALTKEPGFIYTLALILLRDLFMTPEDIVDINPREHLNFQEITFLTGLFLKDKVDLTVPTEEDSARRFEDVYRLFLELHKSYHETFLQELGDLAQHGRRTETREENYRRIFGAGPMVAESIFYAGSGAYDFQYLEFAAQKYRHDRAWIRNHIGVDVSEIGRIAQELKALHERKFNNLINSVPSGFSELCKFGLNVFCFDERDLRKFGDASGPFLSAFSVLPGEVNADLEVPGQYNELHSKPIIRLEDGRYFLPIGFSLSEAIYETPFYWMNRDKSYAATALVNRGRFAENATAELMTRVFGSKNVYCDVEVREKKGRVVTDIDVLAVVGNKAIVGQVKAKRLTELARRGDEAKLLADFKAAVQGAYDQGLRCRKALLDKKNKLFVNGQEIHLSEFIDDAYLMCVTLDHYPAVTHQVSVYLKKEPADPLPVALSIFDLDVLTFYLPDPFEFAYYLRQRIVLSDYFKADSEITLLGRHLHQKLFKSREATFEMLDGSYAQLVDANFQVMRGAVPHTPSADRLRTQWKNDEFQKLVNQIKLAPEAGFTDAVFFLYDLAGEGADKAIEVLKLTKEKAAADHRSHDARLPFLEDRAGITVLCEPTSREALRGKLLYLCQVAKYKSRADVWLALGCLSTSPNLVDDVAFLKYRWELDPELEKLAAHLQGRLITFPGEKIGRNAPCPCGSSKKFKHCHGS
jgi:hypothetical protein